VRALITGDLGFLGRHFRTELEARGYDVTGLDTKRTSSQDCRAYFTRNIGARVPGRYDLVVHAAAVIGGRETIDGSPLATSVNFALDAEMFHWAAAARPGRVVYFSSSAAYPVWLQDAAHRYSLTEHMMNGAEPDQLYGLSKVVGEQMADRLRDAGVPVTVVRPFSGYGEDQDDTYPFRAFIERARRREDPFGLWCGDCVRDFVHVDDIVAATLALAGADAEIPVNIATGIPTSFTRLAELVCAAAGYTPDQILPDPGKPSGVAYRVGDPELLQTVYTPRVTLEEGIARCFPKEDTDG
jgi:nucleoside-diphosphate-sugar epimerase